MKLVTIITFTIDGISHEAVENMTWGAWCDSGYNILGYGLSSDGSEGIMTDNGILFDIQKGRQCLASDTIVNDGEYEEY